MRHNGKPPFKLHPIFGALAPDVLPHEVMGDKPLDLHDINEAKRLAWLTQARDPRDYELIGKIVDRVHDIARDHHVPPGTLGDRRAMALDILNCHVRGCPLNLLQLLMSSDDDITHDVLELVKHLDRDSGQLMHGWRPRHAAKKGGA